MSALLKHKELQVRLAEAPLVREALTEFRRITGLVAKLVPVSFPAKPIRLGLQESEFCDQVGALSGGCQHCQKTQEELFRRLGQKLKPHQIYCPGGLIHLAVPVVVEGRHVATLVAGKVRAEWATPKWFEALEPKLRQLGANGELPELRAAYLSIPQPAGSEIRAAARLLDLLGRLLAQNLALVRRERERPEMPHVAEAKRFAGSHLEEPFTTRQVASRLGLSEAYFCRLFRRQTGMTFRAYVRHLRVETAKTLLATTHQRVTDIAFAAGFQSVWDFNRVFKAKVKVAPSEFRREAWNSTLQ